MHKSHGRSHSGHVGGGGERGRRHALAAAAAAAAAARSILHCGRSPRKTLPGVQDNPPLRQERHSSCVTDQAPAHAHAHTIFHRVLASGTSPALSMKNNPPSHEGRPSPSRVQDKLSRPGQPLLVQDNLPLPTCRPHLRPASRKALKATQSRNLC